MVAFSVRTPVSSMTGSAGAPFGKLGCLMKKMLNKPRWSASLENVKIIKYL